MAIVKDSSGNSPINLGVDPTSGHKDRIGKIVAVTASDSVDLPQGICEAICVTTAGDYKLTMDDDSTGTPYLAAGIWHPLRVKRVWSTGSVSTAGIDVGY